MRAFFRHHRREGTVYDLCGRVVKSHVSNFRETSLPKGIYLFQGKKYVKD